MKKWVKVELKPKSKTSAPVEFVRFLCNYAGFKASKNEDRIPYKVREYGYDWVRVLLNGHPVYVPEYLTIPCKDREPRREFEETWEGN